LQPCTPDYTLAVELFIAAGADLDVLLRCAETALASLGVLPPRPLSHVPCGDGWLAISDKPERNPTDGYAI
jgi:hypothetical protein